MLAGHQGRVDLPKAESQQGVDVLGYRNDADRAGRQMERVQDGLGLSVGHGVEGGGDGSAGQVVDGIDLRTGHESLSITGLPSSKGPGDDLESCSRAATPSDADPRRGDHKIWRLSGYLPLKVLVSGKGLKGDDESFGRQDFLHRDGQLSKVGRPPVRTEKVKEGSARPARLDNRGVRRMRGARRIRRPRSLWNFGGGLGQARCQRDGGTGPADLGKGGQGQRGRGGQRRHQHRSGGHAGKSSTGGHAALARRSGLPLTHGPAWPRRVNPLSPGWRPQQAGRRRPRGRGRRPSRRPRFPAAGRCDACGSGGEARRSRMRTEAAFEERTTARHAVETRACSKATGQVMRTT